MAAPDGALALRTPLTDLPCPFPLPIVFSCAGEAHPNPAASHSDVIRAVVVQSLPAHFPLAVATPAVTETISDVSLPIIPAEIGEMIVSWVVVKVTCFLSLRAWSDEGDKHKAMNEEVSDNSVTAEAHSLVAALVYSILQDPAPVGDVLACEVIPHLTVKASYPSAVGDLVSAFVSYYRCPVFHGGNHTRILLNCEES